MSRKRPEASAYCAMAGSWELGVSEAPGRERKWFWGPSWFWAPSAKHLGRAKPLGRRRDDRVAPGLAGNRIQSAAQRIELAFHLPRDRHGVIAQQPYRRRES